MAEKQTFILGLIGGVGAGKSTVLTLLKDHYGFYVIQTDLTARSFWSRGRQHLKRYLLFLAGTF